MLPLLKLACFGPFSVEANGQPITRFRTQKTQALLAYLALEGKRPLPRRHLADILWHGYQHETALASVRVSLANLRQILAPLNLFRSSRQTVQWCGTEPEVWCDALIFASLLPTPAGIVSPAQVQTALQLYTGDFLAGFESIDSQPFQKWLAGQRAYYRSQAEQLRQRASARVAMYLTPPAHNLPRTFTALIGRESAIDKVRQLLLDTDYPLITLLGEGGVGKTRLALAVAQSIYDLRLTIDNATGPSTAATGRPASFNQTADNTQFPFPDGVWFVALAGVAPLKLATEPSAVVAEEEPAQVEEIIADAIGKALGLTFTGSAPLRTQLCDQLQHKALLLVLDNFEHLVQGGNLLLALLQKAHGITILVTTRQRLHLQAEHIYHVAGLPVPSITETPSQPSEVASYPSVQLFVARARNTTAGFELTPANQAAVAQLCVMLGGLPLALELAAAQIEIHSPTEVLQHLQASFADLTTDLADIPPRHRDLRRVLATSWQL